MRQLGAFGGFGGGRRGGAGTRSARRCAAAEARTSGFDEFDIGGLGGLGDIFSSMFGGGARAAGAHRRALAGPQRGQDVESTLEIPFRTAALGGKVPVELDVNEECAHLPRHAAPRRARSW